MPSKYSHSVVLANYSSRGIISFPNDQQLDYLKAAQSPQSVSPSGRGSRAASTSSAQCRGQPSISSTIEDAIRPEKSSRWQSRRNSKSKLYHHDVTREICQKGERNNSTSDRVRDPRLQSSETQPPSLSRLTPPRRQPNNQPQLAPDATSLALSNKRQEDTDISKPPQRTLVYAAQTVQPRKTTSNHTGVRPPPVSSSLKSSKASITGDIEALLSLQQFLDSSPRIEKPDHAEKPKPIASKSRPPTRHSAASPGPEPKTILNRLPPKKREVLDRRAPTSFIDSSDEDDHVATTPGTSVRSVRSPATPHSKPNFNSDGRIEMLKEDDNAERTRLDLTNELPVTTDEEEPPTGPKVDTHRASNIVADDSCSRQTSEDIDASFDPLPLQRHSPLQRTKSKVKRRSLPPQRSHWHESDDVVRGTFSKRANKSVDESSPKTHMSRPEPDFSNFSDEGDENEVEDSTREPRSTISVHKRYYRAIDKDIPQNELTRQLSPAQSWHDRRAARTPDAVARQSSSLEIKQQGEPETSKHDPNILTDASPRRLPPASKPSPKQDMSNFGVPSIIRSPEKRSKSQYHGQDERDTASPSPSISKTRLSPLKSRQQTKQHQKLQKSHVQRLSRITEAKSLNATPSSSDWRLTIPDAARGSPSMDLDAFGVEEIFRRLSRDDEIKSESQGTDTEPETGTNPKARDNFSTDITILPADQGPHPTASPRPTRPQTPHHNAIPKHSLDLTISPLSSPLRPSPGARAERTYEIPDDVSELSEVSELEDSDADAEAHGFSDGDDEEAACPPDITRYRRGVAADADDYRRNDGMQSLMSALRAGPGPEYFNTAHSQAPGTRMPVPIGSGSGIDRLEEKIRLAEGEIRRKNKKRSRKTGLGMGVFGRLLRR